MNNDEYNNEDGECITPLHIKNAQSASPCPLITAHEVGSLDTQRCKIKRKGGDQNTYFENTSAIHKQFTIGCVESNVRNYKDIDITKDHPVVKKILDFIDKEIRSEKVEIHRASLYYGYLGSLPEDELVTYALYKKVVLVPSIYDYKNTKFLSESDSNLLVNLMSGEF